MKPAITRTKIERVAIVAKVCLNFSLLLKKSRIGFPISVSIKATTRYIMMDWIRYKKYNDTEAKTKKPIALKIPFAIIFEVTI